MSNVLQLTKFKLYHVVFFAYFFLTRSHNFCVQGKTESYSGWHWYLSKQA